MKVYCQFMKMSTGYIEGSIPPEFDDAHKKEIDAVGSDGVFILDARNSTHNMIESCKQRAKQLNKGFVSFKIIKASRFSDNGRVLHYQKLN